MKPNADSMTVEGRKSFESIHISEHIWSINQNTESINKPEKYNNSWKEEQPVLEDQYLIIWLERCLKLQNKI